MNSPAASNCKSCGALIFWVTWPASGKNMPVDAAASQDGDIVLTWKPREQKLWAAKAAQLGEHELVSRNRYVSHFSTCPQAKQHRRAK